MVLFDLNNKIAVVTGIMGNLGPIWAETLLEAGAKVFGLDRPGVEESPTFQELIAQYGKDRLTLFHADVLDRSALEKAREHCLNIFGSIDILVNNAGIDQPPGQTKGWLPQDVPFDVCKDIFAVNALGAFQCAQVFGEEMIKQERGSIINIGSMYGTASPDSKMYDHIPADPPFLKPPAYGASKAALANFSQYLATLWGKYGVRVNTLSPGGVLGGQDEQFKEKFCNRVPMGRMAVSDDLKGPLLFLASDASSYVTGIDLLVDGGFTCW